MQISRTQPISTFSLAITPVLVGTSLAWAEGSQFHWQPAIFAMVAALLIQIIYNRARYAVNFRPLGGIFGEEALIFLIFGPGVVLGAYYLQNSYLSLNSLFAACAIGLQAAAIQTVENRKHLNKDLDTNPFSLTTNLRPHQSQTLFSSLLLLPFLALVPLILFRPVAGIALVTLSPAIRMIRFFCGARESYEFDRILAGTAMLQFIFGAALGIGLVFG